MLFMKVLLSNQDKLGNICNQNFQYTIKDYLEFFHIIKELFVFKIQPILNMAIQNNFHNKRNIILLANSFFKNYLQLYNLLLNKNIDQINLFNFN